jgi:hypothetical protein
MQMGVYSFFILGEYDCNLRWVLEHLVFHSQGHTRWRWTPRKFHWSLICYAPTCVRGFGPLGIESSQSSALLRLSCTQVIIRHAATALTGNGTLSYAGMEQRRGLQLRSGGVQTKTAGTEDLLATHTGYFWLPRLGTWLTVHGYTIRIRARDGDTGGWYPAWETRNR